MEIKIHLTTKQVCARILETQFPDLPDELRRSKWQVTIHGQGATISRKIDADIVAYAVEKDLEDLEQNRQAMRRVNASHKPLTHRGSNHENDD